MNHYRLFGFIVFPLFASYVWAQGTLGEAAGKAGLNIGIATNSFNVNGNNANYKTLANTQFNILVCENEMKFQSTEPSRGRFTYSGGDQVSNFAKANGMRMRGHNLVWHAQSGWAATVNANREEMLGIMKTHIDSVVGHFKGKMLEWDVLNEITSDAGNGLRNSFWQQRIGNDYVDSAFVYAHRVDPTAKLYYNEYGAEGMNAKSNSVFALVTRLKSSGIPIDGVGLQCHLGKGLNQKDISTNIKRLGELGLRVSMTEIDIKNGTKQDWTNLMGACLENFNCVSFVTWGLSDAMSWIGSNCDCLLYDGQLQAKAQVEAIVAALGNADPVVAKKRLDFAKGTLNSIAWPREVASRAPSGGFAGSSPVPVFSIRTGSAFDVLGRNRILQVAHIPGLSILPE